MKQLIIHTAIVMSLVLGMALPLAKPVIAANTSISVTPHTASHHGEGVLSFSWGIWNWDGIAAYYTLAVHVPGQPDPLFIQYSDGAGTDHFPGISLPLQDIMGTVGAPDVHLRNPQHPDSHDWTVPAGLEPGSYRAWVRLYLEGETHPTAGVFVSFNIAAPSIDLQKAVWDGTSWHDADTPQTGPDLPGSVNPVIFRFVIVNTGHDKLTDVTLTDPDMASLYEDFACTIPATFAVASLAENYSVTVYGKLDWEAGQHSNTARVEGLRGTVTVEDTDSCHYLGSGASIHLKKHVNGQDADSPTGPLVEVGSTITFDFVVTNAGDVELAPVVVTDDVLGNIGTIESLTAGASQTLTVTATALAGQHSNMGTATGTPPTGPDVSATARGHYNGSSAAPPPPDSEPRSISRPAIVVLWIVLSMGIITGAIMLVRRRGVRP